MLLVDRKAFNRNNWHACTRNAHVILYTVFISVTFHTPSLHSIVCPWLMYCTCGNRELCYQEFLSNIICEHCIKWFLITCLLFFLFGVCLLDIQYLYRLVFSNYWGFPFSVLNTKNIYLFLPSIPIFIGWWKIRWEGEVRSNTETWPGIITTLLKR